jgi:hypothetical protein
MDDAFLNQRKEAIADLLQKLKSSFLGNVVVQLDVLLKVRIAYLLDDVVVMAALHHVQHLHDVVRFQQLQDLDLGEQSCFEVLVVVDCFRGDVLSFFSRTFTAH